MNASFLSAERVPRPVPVEDPAHTSRRVYFSELAQSLYPSNCDTRARSLMFVSPHPGAGVSFVSSHLATELVSADHCVLLADASTLLRFAPRPGDSFLQQCEPVDAGRFYVLGPKQKREIAHKEPGSSVPSASFLRGMRESFTHVLIDAPAVSESDDALMLSTSVYGVIVIAQAGKTSKQAIVQTCKSFTSLGARVLGTIFNAHTPGAKGEMVR